MSCSFYVVLLEILTVILQIYQVGGECSIAKTEECRLVGRLCSSNQCDPCESGYIEVDSACYDPDIVLERLENCDPNNNPECKTQLEGIRDQLAGELNFKRNEVKISSPSLTKPADETTNGRKDIPLNGSKLKKYTNINKPPLMKDENLANSSADVGLDSMLNESETNAFSREIPSDNGSGDRVEEQIPDVYFLIIIIACTLSGVAGIALSGYCWYKLHNNDDKTSKSEYIPGVRKTNGKSTPTKNGDRKLDYKAEMYHYVHTKNQIAAMENAKTDHLGSEGVSQDEEDDAEDYTVYECPGLAPTGDMTVVNPLFSDQEVAGSDEGRGIHSNHSSPSTPARSNMHSPSSSR